MFHFEKLCERTMTGNLQYRLFAVVMRNAKHVFYMGRKSAANLHRLDDFYPLSYIITPAYVV